MKISKIKKSRVAWKGKAKDRGKTIRNIKKTAKARKKRADQKIQNEQELQRLKEEIEQMRAERDRSAVLAKSDPTVQQRILCVQIVIVGIVSFRSVPRILKVFLHLLMTKLKIPHFTSVIHWTLRVGVAVFNQVSLISCPWVAIIDCSIDVGIRKALVVLRVPLAAFQNKQGAIGLQDCECIGLEVAEKWNGQLVFEALNKIFGKAGAPIAIIKDGGTDIKKGVELLCEKNPDLNIQTIDDIGHFTANALKALFATAKQFVKFLEIVSKGASRIRQTTLAWLLPPKIRTKGRFQGITKVAEWAQRTLVFLGGQRKAKEGSDLSRARKAFAGLAKLRPFLIRFCNICRIAEEILKLMKTEGLNQSSYVKANKLLEQLPKRSLIKTRLLGWLEKHINIHRDLGIGDLRLLVSSDVIESLFGKFKTIIQRNPLCELNRLVYVIPLLCGHHTTTDIEQALKECSQANMLRQIKETIPPTLRQQRNKELNKCLNLVPKSGYLKLLETG
ncbi:MAG: hypothetical protein ACD_66C00134G0002 [uncultured bacterium]|nr:MAG: hypothetical protein ACD_66C00134G0002 [uncultured bacterium]